MRDNFNSRDTDIILSIPLNPESHDTWYWRQEKLGDYSVKSAYSMLRDIKQDNSGASNSGLWRKLWNLKIPLKVKHFLWRACTHCLPTKDQLLSKRIQLNILCPSCNEYPETTLHALVSCPFAVRVWSRFQLRTDTDDVSSYQEWLQSIFIKHENDKIADISMVCWMIWKHRNELVWNQHGLEVSEVVNSAISSLNQWRSVQDKTFSRFMAFMNHDDGVEHWYPPMTNRVKINVDAAIFEDSHNFSHAVIVRDHDGNLVEAMSKCMQGKPSPDVAEALGIKEALSWVKNGSWVDAIIESDCLQVVQAIRSPTPCLSYLGRVVKECQDILASLSRRNICLRFVKRSANRVAHYLARYSCSNAERRWRVGDVHSDFLNVLLADLNHQ